MLIEIRQILPDNQMIIKIINPQTGEFPEKLPEYGKQYQIYPEEIKPEEVPEFNK